MTFGPDGPTHSWDEAERKRLGLTDEEYEDYCRIVSLPFENYPPELRQKLKKSWDNHHRKRFQRGLAAWVKRK